MRPKTRRDIHIHASRRAEERYDFKLRKDEIDQVSKMICEQHHQGHLRSGAVRFVHRSSLARTVWKIFFKGVEFLAVYDKPRGGVVTFLPPTHYLWNEKE